MARKKTKFQSFFSFTRHQKRWGAKKFTAPASDFEALKTKLVEPTDTALKFGHQKALDDHIANLRVEFAGQPEIIFEHAKLIVLIRRQYKEQEIYQQFRSLWQQEHVFLAENLNLRWLISAVDTIADCDTDMSERAIAMIGSTLASTVKIYETERFIRDTREAPAIQERIDALQPTQHPLFEGLEMFRVGGDDTLRNMRWRLEPLFDYGLAGPITRAIFMRLQNNDSGYGRMKALHTRDKTAWWYE